MRRGIVLRWMGKIRKLQVIENQAILVIICHLISIWKEADKYHRRYSKYRTMLQGEAQFRNVAEKKLKYR